MEFILKKRAFKVEHVFLWDSFFLDRFYHSIVGRHSQVHGCNKFWVYLLIYVAVINTVYTEHASMEKIEECNVMDM